MAYENMLNILSGGLRTKPTWDYMDSRLNALKSLGMEQDIQMQPQKLAMEQERLGLAREQLGVSKGHLGISQGQFDLDKQRFSAGKEAKEAAKRDMLFQRIQEYPESVSLETWDELLKEIPEKYRRDIPTAKEWMESMGRSGVLTEGADPDRVFKEQIIPKYISTTQKHKERRLQVDEMEAGAKMITATREGKAEAPYSDVGKAEADRQRYLRGGYPADHPVIIALDKKISGEQQGEKDKVPASMEDFEKTIYGKLVPEKRGTVEYKTDRLKWINDQKEQSPYTKAFEKQNEIRKREYGTNLRKEFNALPETKSFITLREKSDAMNAALDESKTSKNFIAVDQVLITLFNKMTDPDSVVRESEYERTVENMPFINRFTGAFEKVKKGGAGLTQEDREALVKMAGRLRQVSEKKYNERYYEFRSYLEKNDLNPDEFLPARAKKGGTEVLTEKEARRRLKDMNKSDEEIQGYINKYRQEGVVK